MEVYLWIQWLTWIRKKKGTVACQETGDHAQAYEVMHRGIRADMAKARLPEAQSPEGAIERPLERRLQPTPPLRQDEEWPVVILWVRAMSGKDI